jgi:hypothetical protein
LGFLKLKSRCGAGATTALTGHNSGNPDVSLIRAKLTQDRGEKLRNKQGDARRKSPRPRGKLNIHAAAIGPASERVRPGLAFTTRADQFCLA